MKNQAYFSCFNYFPFFQNCFVFIRESNKFRLKIMMVLLIKRKQPAFTQIDTSILLEML